MELGVHNHHAHYHPKRRQTHTDTARVLQDKVALHAAARPHQRHAGGRGGGRRKEAAPTTNAARRTTPRRRRQEGGGAPRTTTPVVVVTVVLQYKDKRQHDNAQDG